MPTNSAVLDLHFHPLQQDLLAIATSTGSVEFYHLRKNRLTHSWSHQIALEETLVLQLAFISSAKKPPISGDEESGCEDDEAQSRIDYAVTLSTGDFSLASHTGTGLFENSNWTFQTFPAHSLEAWSVNFCKSTAAESAQIYTGGDDSTLISHALCLNVEDGAQELWSAVNLVNDRKTHQAGVTAILPVRTDDEDLREILLTGSYDETVRVYYPLAKPRDRVLAEQRLGGGVWRLKHIEGGHEGPTKEGMKGMEGMRRHKYLVLASCMHAGARILGINCKGGEWSIEVLAKFEEHESMNYGSDCQPSDGLGGGKGEGEGRENLICVSTSFYDRRLCVWIYDLACRGLKQTEVY